MPYEFRHERFRKMPLRTRIAIGAVLVDRVERLYSEYFRKTFLQDKTFRVITDFLKGKQITAKRLQTARDKLGGVVEQAEEEGYGFHEVWMPGFLIGELVELAGKGTSGAIGATGIAFGCQVLYRLGLTAADHRLDIELVDSLEEPVFEAARQVIAIAEEIPEAEVSLKHFSSIALPDPSDHSIIPQVILDIAKKGPTKGYPPPIHEGLGRDK